MEEADQVIQPEEPSNGTPLLNPDQTHEQEDTLLDESLKKLETFLCFFGFHQSSFLSFFLSWAAFAVVGVLVPVLILVLSGCSSCEKYQITRFELDILVSQTCLAAVSLLCISHNLRKHGIRRFLFVDRYHGHMVRFHKEYVKKLQMYFVSKTLAEKAGWEFAKEHNLDFISIIPTLVIGSFLLPSMPPSLITGLSRITRNESHYSIIKQGQFVHVDDIWNAHIFLYEHPEAKGRYICSSHDDTITNLAKMLRKLFPEYNVPTKLPNIDENLSVVKFSSKKLLDLGFQYKYSFQDMFVDAVETCRKKGLLPLPSETQVCGKSREIKKHEAEKINGSA